MQKIILGSLSILLITCAAFAQETDSSDLWMQDVEASLQYQTGVIELESGNATLNVPKGYRYLDKEQSIYVLSDLWGNPPDSSVLGMLVPEHRGVLDSSGWAFTISYDEIGFVKDDDAEDIDYDELLAEQQQEIREANPERISQGYGSLELVRWASAPYYDKDKKILHWAKELKFNDDSLHTLNYNLRVLGRKGIFILNAVASMRELPQVKANIDKVITSVSFKEGHRYSDFDDKIDDVAAWTIGGLVAGKVLAKAGFFVVLLKFWKVIALAVAGGFGAIWKRFMNRDQAESYKQ